MERSKLRSDQVYPVSTLFDSGAVFYQLKRFKKLFGFKQIGSGDRSERIRTYNFPQGRITDHRVGITSHAVDDILMGEDLDVFIDALLFQQEMDAIASFSARL